jgi:hypothetical protein
MTKTKSTSYNCGPGSTVVNVKTGMARHKQIVRAALAADSHGTGSGAAKQARGRRKAGSYSVR